MRLAKVAEVLQGLAVDCELPTSTETPSGYWSR